MSEENTIAPGSEAHDAAMAAKYDQAQGVSSETQDAGVTQETQQEELLLGKFKSAEDLAQAYKELEAKLGQQKAPEGDAQEAPKDAAQEAVENAGLDFNSLSQEFQEQGQLSEDSYTKLEKAGIPKAVVDQYIAGQQALVEGLQLQAYNVAGGEAQYQSMVGWAKANMSPDEIATFNMAVGSNNVDAIKLAVLGLKARYEGANGSEPDLIGGNQGNASGDVFESWAQVRAAMSDPLYKKDPAYRSKVEAKLGRSNPI